MTILKYLMPQKLIDFVFGAKEFLRGKKTYLAATILLLQALFGYTEQVLDINSVAGFIDFLGGFAANEATIRLAEALALFGIRAAIGGK